MFTHPQFGAQPIAARALRASLIRSVIRAQRERDAQRVALAPAYEAAVARRSPQPAEKAGAATPERSAGARRASYRQSSSSASATGCGVKPRTEQRNCALLAASAAGLVTEGERGLFMAVAVIVVKTPGRVLRSGFAARARVQQAET